MKNKAGILFLTISMISIYIINKHLNRKQISEEFPEENIKLANLSNPGSTNKVKKLPSIAILGVKKCGTIALSKMLKMHPKLETPTDPEIWFWTMPKLFAKGLDYYKAQMPYVDNSQEIAVATPGILDNPNDTRYLARLRDAISDIKVLLIVKNPIDRVVSDILHEYSVAQHRDEVMPDLDDLIMGRAGQIEHSGISGLSLNEMVFYLSNYTLIYQMISSVFDSKNIMVVNGDKIVTDPLQEIRRVESFLELPEFYHPDHFFYPEDGRFPCFNFGEHNLCMDPKHKGREHPQLKHETLQFLQLHFQPMVETFFIESGISLQNFMEKFS